MSRADVLRDFLAVPSQVLPALLFVCFALGRKDGGMTSVSCEPLSTNISIEVAVSISDLDETLRVQQEACSKEVTHD